MDAEYKSGRKIYRLKIIPARESAHHQKICATPTIPPRKYPST